MSEPRQPVIVGGARTPVGRLLGSLATKSASELGGVAIAGALDHAGVGPDQVQYVIMGQVLQAGAGQITARQAAVAAGLSMSVPALTSESGIVTIGIRTVRMEPRNKKITTTTTATAWPRVQITSSIEA